MNSGLLIIAGLAAFIWYKRQTPPVLLPPTGGTTDPDGTNTGTANQYIVWLAELENPAWTWSTRPAIFNEVPLSPGSRERWIALNKIYQDISDTNLEYYALEREFDEYEREGRGSNEAKNSPEWQAITAKRAQLDKAARDLAQIQRDTESQYKKGLELRFTADEIAQFYQRRANEILNGIWPANDTQIVPPANNGGSIPTGPGSGGPGAGAPDLGPGMGDQLTMFSQVKPAARRQTPVIQYDLKRDAARQALPPGRRVSDTGRVYYERRANRSDKGKYL